VNLDPQRLEAFGLGVDKVVEAVRRSNNDVGARLVEFTGREYMVRGRGYVRGAGDIERTVVAVNPETGAPITLRELGNVTLGPDLRRGIAELDGEGEVVGGIVVMRYNENAEQVIERVRARLKEIEPSLPEGVEVVTTYDRAELIERAVDNLKDTLVEEMVIVCAVILLFLWHIPSALIPIATIPVTVLLAFIPMQAMGITANIMSLGGIAVAIGAMVDAAIVVVEQTHKKLELWNEAGQPGSERDVIIQAVKEVGGPSFFALLVIAVSFVPVFALEGQEGRLFKPLAFTKNFSMAIAAVMAITLDPAMRLLFTHARNFEFRPRWLARGVNAVLVGKIRSEQEHPISRPLMRLYQPAVHFVLEYKWTTIVAALLVFLLTIPIFFRLGSEFMPPLDEGSLLYMPSTLPGISITEAARLLEIQDRILRSFPEVESVFGKAGRAETATDPAPLSMMETVVVLKPRDQWRFKKQWYSDRAPEWLKKRLRRSWPERISTEELIYGPGGLNEALQLPGQANAWTMPIKARIDMLTTGVRSQVGIKVLGTDLITIEEIGRHIEMAIRDVPGTSSVYSERTAGGYFLDFDFNREALARYGLAIEDVQGVLTSAVGGEQVSTTLEGRERFPVNVRYFRDFRSDLGALERVLVPTPDGAQIPLGQLAQIRKVTGPGMIRNENGRLSGYVYVDIAGRDVGGYVEEARRVVQDKVRVPAGYSLVWSGQYENMERAKARLKVVLPVTLLAIFLLLYMNTRSIAKTMIVLLAVPFSAVGAIWFLYALDYNMSIAVWVGLIALLGVDAETGVFMLLYLDLAYQEARARGGIRSWGDLRDAVVHGAVKRLRPKLMTVATMFFGLVPIMWSAGTGADVMKRIAAPMVGGIFTSFLLELLVYPPIFELWKWHGEVKPELKESGLL
jgi:Cu(I)/Ag(I) efflux system membrane protein CusA/SilA